MSSEGERTFAQSPVDPSVHLNALNELLHRARQDVTAAERRLQAAYARVEGLEEAVLQARENAARHANMAQRDGLWREAMRRLATFTADELAAEMDAKPAQARYRITACLEDGTLEPAGRGLGKQMYRYRQSEGEQ